MTVISRSSKARIIRESPPKEQVRDEEETKAAKRMGNRPNELKEVFRDVYEFYQNNEC